MNCNQHRILVVYLYSVAQASATSTWVLPGYCCKKSASLCRMSSTPSTSGQLPAHHFKQLHSNNTCCSWLLMLQTLL